MVFLYDLENIVRTQIRDNGTTQAFENTELDQFIMDAIAQYSRVRPRKRPYTLAITSGQSTYTLPTDWIRADDKSLDRAKNPRPQVGLLGIYGYEYDQMLAIPPMLGLRHIRFDFYNSDQTLILTPAPLAAYNLTFDYFAMHQVGNTTNCTIPADDLYASMWWASAQALYALAMDKSGKLLVYKAKDVDVNNEASVTSLKAQADSLIQRWERWIMRPQGQRGGDLEHLDWGMTVYGPWGSPL